MILLFTRISWSWTLVKVLRSDEYSETASQNLLEATVGGAFCLMCLEEETLKVFFFPILRRILSPV